MIAELRIDDLGVIQTATLPFHPGFTAVTGETGAGKTMVVTGLGLLFGGRADPALVRSPAQAAHLEGIIDVPAGHPALARAAEAGADTAEDLILHRTVSGAGRGRAFAGGRSVPIGVLAELAEQLIAVHGQSDQWRLRSGDQQRELLDAYAGAPVQSALRRYRTRLAAWREAGAEHARLSELAASRSADLDLLRAGVERIEAVDPKAGEEDQLRTEVERLSHAEHLRAAASGAAAALLGEETNDQAGAGDLLARAGALMAPVVEYDPALAELAARCRELSLLASELGSDLTRYADGVDLDQERLAQLQERRAELAGLARAYGGDLDAALRWLADASTRLLAVDSAVDGLAAAVERHVQTRAELAEAAEALSAARKRAATKVAKAVTAELRHLAMGSAALHVEVNSREDADAAYGAAGVDDVEFLLRSGSGMPARPLAKAASGGELSRVMLAIEVVLGAGGQSVPTYVFDEVDAGVGGRAAVDLGARLARLARTAQVIVVTHLPQVAAFANRHLVVTKADDGRVSRSHVRVVEGQDREAEIARMMAGWDSHTARGHARELLQSAQARAQEWDD